LDDDKPKSTQSYGDPFIALPAAPPVLAYTTYPADPRHIGLRLGIGSDSHFSRASGPSVLRDGPDGIEDRTTLSGSEHSGAWRPA